MTHHLADDRLFDCYVAEQGSERPDPRLAEHLADCVECARRYAELAGFMDGLRTEADAETDAVFTPERLQAQQQQIVSKIAHVGQPAKIISFPRRVAAATVERHVPHIATRWVAAAAAAGLFIGIGAGIFLESAPRARVTQTASVSRPHIGGAPAPRLTPADLPDDPFFSDLDLALARPRTAALMPLDSITPHVREVSNTR